MTCENCGAPFPPHPTGSPKRYCNRSCAASHRQRAQLDVQAMVDALREMIGMGPLYASEPTAGADWLPRLRVRERIGRQVIS